MKILILDNYDSFTYNLVHIVRELGYNYDVVRNDAMTLDEVDGYDKIILSPGPGIPDEAGIMKEVIRKYGPTKSILGVCLGHQGIAEVYGGELFNLENVLHGVTSEILVKEPDNMLFAGLPRSFQVCHYHSWIVRPELPGELVVTAEGTSGMIMALRHTTYDVCGVQFHPESIMTPEGPKMISNWLSS